MNQIIHLCKDFSLMTFWWTAWSAWSLQDDLVSSLADETQDRMVPSHPVLQNMLLFQKWFTRWIRILVLPKQLETWQKMPPHHRFKGFLINLTSCEGVEWRSIPCSPLWSVLGLLSDCCSPLWTNWLLSKGWNEQYRKLIKLFLLRFQQESLFWAF